MLRSQATWCQRPKEQQANGRHPAELAKCSGHRQHRANGRGSAGRVEGSLEFWRSTPPLRNRTWPHRKEMPSQPQACLYLGTDARIGLVCRQVVDDTLQEIAAELFPQSRPKLPILREDALVKGELRWRTRGCSGHQSHRPLTENALFHSAHPNV